MKYWSYLFQIQWVLCECIAFQMVLVLIFFLGEKNDISIEYLKESTSDDF